LGTPRGLGHHHHFVSLPPTPLSSAMRLRVSPSCEIGLLRIASKIELAAWYLTEETELPDSEIGCTVLLNRPGRTK